MSRVTHDQLTNAVAALIKGADAELKKHERLMHNRYEMTSGQLYDRIHRVNDCFEDLAKRVQALSEFLGVELRWEEGHAIPSHYKAVKKGGAK